MMEINSRETKYLIEVLRAAAKGEKPAAPEGIDWNEFLNCQKSNRSILWWRRLWI